MGKVWDDLRDEDIVRLPRDGFTAADQEYALAQCKRMQLGVQNGLCALCNNRMSPSRSAWVVSGTRQNLRKWTFGEDDGAFDPVNLVFVVHQKSPAVIIEEYKRGGHELAHRGCVIRFKNYHGVSRGRKGAILDEYTRMVRERGLDDGSLRSRPEVITALWNEATENVEARRLDALRTASEKGIEALKSKNPDWGTGKWREERREKARAKRRAERKRSRKRRERQRDALVRRTDDVQPTSPPKSTAYADYLQAQRDSAQDPETRAEWNRALEEETRQVQGGMAQSQQAPAEEKAPKRQVRVGFTEAETAANYQAAQEEAVNRSMTDMERACYGDLDERLAGITDRILAADG